MTSMVESIPKLADIIYATLIKETQVALDSQEFSVPFKKRSKEDRILIKKEILVQLKQYSEEVAEKIKGEKTWKGNTGEIASRLKEIIQRCMDDN